MITEWFELEYLCGSATRNEGGMVELGFGDGFVDSSGQVALIGASAVACAFVLKHALLNLIAFLLGIRRSPFAMFARHSTDALEKTHGVTQYTRQADGRIVRRLTLEERRKLERGAPIALYAPSPEGGAILLDDAGRNARRAKRTKLVDIGARLKGDMKRCATARGIVALFDEPRYCVCHSKSVFDAVLQRLVDVAATRHEALAVVQHCAHHAGPPEPERRRFIRLVSDANDDGSLRWDHWSATRIWLRPVDVGTGRLLPVSRASYRNAYVLYFDTSDVLIGWYRVGKVAPLSV
ncbi:MAG: hypothetical protein AAFV69_13170 [Pseudomonadota bacterium]